MKIIFLFLSIFFNSCTSDQEFSNFGECKLRTTLHCGDNSNGPLVNGGPSSQLSNAGLPGKRGQKGEIGEHGLVGPKGEPGINCNITEFENIHKENQKLKKKVQSISNYTQKLKKKTHYISNYTQKLEKDYNELKKDHEFLKSLTYSYMGGNPCVVNVEVSNGSLSKPFGSFIPSGSDVIIRCNEGLLAKEGKKISCQNGKLSVKEKIKCDTIARDCDELKQFDSSLENGVYTINPYNEVTTQVFCDMQTDEHAWTTVQRRFDGSESFARTWSDYLSGFGSRKGEYWLGLRSIYNLMKDKNYKLKFEFERFNGETAYAEYNIFYIGNEQEKFALTFGDYSGTAGDSLGSYSVQGMKFTTLDQDNDVWSGNCAHEEGGGGGWWYSNCQHSSLNGEYQRPGNYQRYNGLNWYTLVRINESLKAVRMKIQKKF